MARGLRETPFSPRPSLRWPGRRNRPSKATGVSQQVLAELWQGPGKVAGGVSGVQDWGGGEEHLPWIIHPSAFSGVCSWQLGLLGVFNILPFALTFFLAPQTLTHCAGHRPRLRVLISPSWAFGQFFSFLFFFFFMDGVFPGSRGGRGSGCPGPLPLTALVCHLSLSRVLLALGGPHPRVAPTPTPGEGSGLPSFYFYLVTQGSFKLNNELKTRVFVSYSL